MSDQKPEQQFGIQRIYVKDISFESPQGAAVFGQPWRPSVQQELATTTTALNDDQYEVVLTVTITATSEEKTVFVVEVQQAGIFLIKGFSGEQIEQIGGINCPVVLFPYARQVIDQMLLLGTLPPLILPPVNFEVLFHQARAQQGTSSTAH